ncbi:MAG TPA: glycosyltransferase [Bacteroidota bacterium]
MKTPYILILAASGGAGHLRAAAALERAAASFEPPVKCKNFDCLDFTSKTFKKLYSESYLAMVNKAPELWGYLYSKAEEKPYTKKGLLKIFDDLNYRSYLQFLKDERPDAIVCTHFLPFISLSVKMRKEGITAPVFAAVTDFDAHQYWVDRVVDRYYVHSEESAWQLRSKGVSANRISVMGIPIMPEFGKREDPVAVRERLGLPQDALTFLMVWGGFGVGKAEEMVKEVVAMLQLFPERHFTLVTICGKNEKLLERIKALEAPSHVTIQPVGFVDNIHEFMNAADVLISKAGGLTSAEAMAMGTPMIIVDPIPGQESRNAEMIVEQRAGWKALDIANIGYKIKRIIEEPRLLEEAKAATAGLARPNAAADILRDVYDTVTKGGMEA